MEDSGAKRICVPVDDSQGSKRALEWALKNVVHTQDKVTLLCVQDILSDPFAAEAVSTPFNELAAVPIATASSRTTTPSAEQACAQTLQNFRRAAASAGLKTEQISTVQVTPSGGASGVGDSIVRYVEATQQDAVVLGSRGMGAVQRAMMGMLGLGSVSDFLVNHSRVPVVVVKPPATAVQHTPRWWQ